MRTSKAMRDIIRDHAISGGHFFSKGAMEFFNSRIEDYPVSRSNDDHNRRFFITSERFDDSSPRTYTIRYATSTEGKTAIETLGTSGTFATLGEAASAITGLFDLALDIGWAAVVDIEDLV